MLPEHLMNMARYAPLIDFVAGSLKAGGWVLIPIFAASVWGWVLVILAFDNVRRLGLPARITKRLLSGNGEALLDWIQDRKSRRYRSTMAVQVLDRILEAGPGASISDLEEMQEEALRHNLPALEAGFTTIAMVGGLAPLLGLLGTVSGMIRTFAVIGSFGNSNPALMAGSIAEALVTAQNGLMVAFPILIVHVLMVNAAARIERDAEALGTMCIEHLKESRGLAA